jgi:voltage-gated potassium channel
VILVTAAVLYGVAGYRIIEHWGLLDSLFMTVITLSTVGYQEVHPLSPAGEIFTITLVLAGIVAFFDLIGAMTALLASGELAARSRARRMSRRLDALSNHFIVCAFGRVGKAAVGEMLRRGAPVVAIETRPEAESEFAEAGIPYIIGDPTQEQILLAAGLTRARGLICAVDSDAVNVYITLTARSIKADLFIVARSSSPESRDRLVRAGANRIVSPYAVSGTRMAALALEPAVLDFLDMVSVAPELRIEEISLSPNSALVGVSVKDACADLEKVMVLAVRHNDGNLVVPAGADTRLAAADLIIALGPDPSLRSLAAAAGPGD